MRNYGQHNALLCGIRAAKYDVIVTMDDDCNIHPKKSRGWSRNWKKDSMSFMARRTSNRHGLMRALASRITRLALRTAIGREVAKNVSAFRVFRTQLREAFADYHTPFVSVDVLLTWATTRFAAIHCRFQNALLRLLKLTHSRRCYVTHLNMMTGFSTAAVAACQPDWIRMHVVWHCGFRLCCEPLLAGGQHPGISFSGVDHCHLFRRTAFRPGGDRRIPRPHPFSDDESSSLRCSKR